MKQELIAATLFISTSLFFVFSEQLSSSSYNLKEIIQHVQTDTTELLSAGPWLHTERDETVYDSTYVRKFHFMKDGNFRIEIKSEKDGYRVDRASWRRNGKKIYLDFPQGVHQWEIVRLESNLLILHFIDRDVMDVLVRQK